MLHFAKVLEILFIQDQPSGIRYQLHTIKELHKFSDDTVESWIDFFLDMGILLELLFPMLLFYQSKS